MRLAPYSRRLLLLCIVAVPGSVGAQAGGGAAGRDPTPDAAAPDSALPPRACFRARPASECRAFLVLEAGVYPRLASTEASRPWGPRRQLDGHGSWEVGYMVNTDPRTAIGGAMVIGTGGYGARFGAKARYRRWLPGGFAADLGAGPISAAIAVPVPSTNPLASTSARGLGLTADVGIGWRGILGASVRADAVRAGGSTGAAVYAGGHVASGAAVAGTAVAVVAVGVAVAALVFGGGG